MKLQNQNPRQRTALLQSGLAIMAGGLMLIIEFVLIQLDLVVVELPDHRVDALSMALAIAAWIFLFIGLKRLAATALLAQQHKLLPIPMAGLGLYTLGCLAIVLEQWRFLFIVPLGLLGTAGGMVIVGVEVLRRKVWPGWQAWTPLLVGLYPFLCMFPVVALYGAPNYSVNYFWGFPWLLLGHSLYAQSYASSKYTARY